MSEWVFDKDNYRKDLWNFGFPNGRPGVHLWGHPLMKPNLTRDKGEPIICPDEVMEWVDFNKPPDVENGMGLTLGGDEWDLFDRYDGGPSAKSPKDAAEGRWEGGEFKPSFYRNRRTKEVHPILIKWERRSICGDDEWKPRREDDYPIIIKMNR